MLKTINDLLSLSHQNIIDVKNGIFVVKNPVLANNFLTNYQDIAIKNSMKSWYYANDLLSESGRFALLIDRIPFEKNYNSILLPLIDDFFYLFQSCIINQFIGLRDLKVCLLKSLLNFFFSVNVHKQEEIYHFIQCCEVIEKHRAMNSWPYLKNLSSNQNPIEYSNALQGQIEFGNLIFEKIPLKDPQHGTNEYIEALVGFINAMSSPLASVIFSSLCSNSRGEIDLEKNFASESKQYISKELFRYFTPAWFINRQLTKGIKIDDIFIPSGSILFFPILAYHTNRDIWGDDCLLFKPERFKTLTAIQKCSYLPFGKGKRACPASKFSNYFVSETLIKLTQLKFKLIDDYADDFYGTVLWRDTKCLLQIES